MDVRSFLKQIRHGTNPAPIPHLDNQIKSAVELPVDGLQQHELRRGSVQAEVVGIGLGFT